DDVREAGVSRSASAHEKWKPREQKQTEKRPLREHRPNAGARNDRPALPERRLGSAVAAGSLIMNRHLLFTHRVREDVCEPPHARTQMPHLHVLGRCELEEAAGAAVAWDEHA